MDRIVEALLRLQIAFELEGLARPGVVLGAPDDIHKLGRMIETRDLIAEPARKRYRPTLAGAKLYEPHEVARG